MKKTLFFIFTCLSLLVSCSAAPPDPNAITGLWKSRPKLDTPRSLVAFYEYKGKFYGRMLGTYDADGNFNDTILEQKDKATGVVGILPIVEWTSYTISCH